MRGCRAARLSDKANCAWFASAKGVRHRVVHKAIRPLALRIYQHETALRTQEAALLYPWLEPLEAAPTTYAITREYHVILRWLARLTLNAKRKSFDDHASPFLKSCLLFCSASRGCVPDSAVSREVRGRPHRCMMRCMRPPHPTHRLSIQQKAIKVTCRLKTLCPSFHGCTASHPMHSLPICRSPP